MLENKDSYGNLSMFLQKSITLNWKELTAEGEDEKRGPQQIDEQSRNVYENKGGVLEYLEML